MTGILKKFIPDDAVDGSKFKLENNQAFRARNFADSADLELFKANVSNQFEMLIQPIFSGSNLATESYVDTGLSGKEDTADKGAANGYCPLDANQKVPTANLPALAISSTTVVADQAARLALAGSVQEGDVAVQTDNGITYILTDAGDGSADGHWQEITAAGAVQSVNGATGVVSLDTDDISEGASNFYYTEARFDTSLAAKDTDDLTEGATNLYHTTARARTAAVVNSTAGNETDQAPSVDAMKSYVSDQASTPAKENLSLNGTDITNQYKDLSAVALASSVTLTPVGGIPQVEGTDYTVSLTGGAGGNTRISFIGGLATGGDQALINGDSIVVKYFT